MDEDQRRDNVADALRPILEEGESYSVYCHEGEIHVREADTSICAVRHPTLYGRLLSLSAQLDQAGAGLSRVPIVVGLSFCAGIHLRWLDDVIGKDLVERLDHWLFFLLVFFIIFQGLSIAGNAMRRGIYRRGRNEIFNLVAEAKLNCDALLAMIEGDSAVARAGHQLKLDTEAPHSTPLPVERG